VLALKETTDFIFIPRYISLSKNAYCCPKLCGLPDMTLLNLKNTLNVIELNIDFNNGKLKTLQSLQKIASILELDYENVENTYNSIMGIYLEDQIHQDMQKTGILNSNKCAAFAVLGHPYVFYDNYISMDLINKLLERGYFVYTPSYIDKKTKYQNADPFYKKVFWDTGYDILGSANIFIQNPYIEGIIYLSAFACGIDSVLTELIERQIKKTNKRYIKITIDEHTGEAGFNTRLDAFLDMVPCLA
jgi:predicted nucleotide-binding protein (sugar kinase/HSP70/actin superfamily)